MMDDLHGLRSFQSRNVGEGLCHSKFTNFDSIQRQAPQSRSNKGFSIIQQQRIA